VCPCASQHLPCCKNCTDGFAIPLEIKRLIESRLKGDKDEQVTTTDSNLESTINTEEGHKDEQNPKLTPAVQDDETTKNLMTEEVDQVDNKTQHCVKIKGETAEEQRGTCRVLVDSERDIISHALGAGHDNGIITQVGSSGGHKVTRQAMKSLKPGVWVKDEVMNAFYYLLSQQDGELCEKDVGRKRNGYFNSFFFTKLLNEGHSNRSGEYEYQNIRNWSTRFVPGEDIFKVGKLFFPINVERQHWVLAVIDMTNQKIQMYDSGSQLYEYKSIGKNGSRCLEILFQYLQDEHLDKKNTPLPNANRWQLIPCQSDTPQQSNSKLIRSSRCHYLTMLVSHRAFKGYDCGVYACMFGDRLSKDAPLTSLSPEEATRNRERLVLSLMERQPLLEYIEVTMINQGEQEQRIEMDHRGASTGDKKEEPRNNQNVKVERTVSKNSDVRVETVDNDDVKVARINKEVEQEERTKTVREAPGTSEKPRNNSDVKVKPISDSSSNVRVETVVDKDDTAVESAGVMRGGQEEGGTGGKDWSQLKVSELKAELRARNLTLSGRKADLVSRLHSSDLERLKVETSEASMTSTSRLSAVELLELQKCQEHLHEIDECISNLKEYRGHLARHVSEDAYAQSKIDNLCDDEAIVTSDYKMKILSCFFRETQKKWFGKRGTNLLGFMITTNSLDEADNLQGVKEVQFVFMVTDDCLTDAWEVACAKTTLYEEFLPDHVKKVRFWSDGAGCFKSKTHRVFQPFWKHWTGVDEIELRITPAGNGKSQLDGRFGRLNFVLQGAVDEGHSYYDAPTILNAIEHSTGLTATKVRTFLPDRSNQVNGDIFNVRFESVLLTLLDPNRNEKDSTKVRAFHHSGYGQGQLLDLSERSIFYEVSGELDEAEDESKSKSKKEKKKRVWREVYNIDVSKTFG
jgi:hypothetical protein